MEPEQVMNLFDSYWFDLEIFTKQPKAASLSTSSETIPVGQPPKLSTQLTVLMRSKSDQLSTMAAAAADFSPNSVLFSPHLQTVLSGKESAQEGPSTPQPEKPKNRGGFGRIKKMSKSLSQLEFEELKGFMDLGFVFSEEDRQSSLVEIIPGLQRMGKEEDKEKPEIIEKNTGHALIIEKNTAHRPYLSEAWEVLEARRREEEKEKPLMNWRVPAVNNEIDMKDSLKWWAHTVASAVR